MMDDVIVDAVSRVFLSLGSCSLMSSFLMSFLSSLPMMIIIVVLSSQSLDDPYHVLTITTHDDDDDDDDVLKSLLSLFL